MAKTDFKSADEYIKTFPAGKQAILKQVREAIRKAVPDAEEVISYQIPAFRLAGGWVFYYSMYTNHFSLACPPPFAAFKEFAGELSGYKQSKSAVNFPLDEPVPVKLIGRMSRFQAEDIEARAKDKAKGGVKVRANRYPDANFRNSHRQDAGFRFRRYLSDDWGGRKNATG